MFRLDLRGIFIALLINITATAILGVAIAGCASGDVNNVARKNSSIQRCYGEIESNKIEIIQGVPVLVYDTKQASTNGC